MEAESVVNSLIQKMGSLQIRDKEYKKVLEEVSKIKEDFEIMKDFLRDADARARSEKAVKTWVKQVREAAHDIEDFLQEFDAIQSKELHHHRHQITAFLHKVGHAFSKQHRKIQTLAGQFKKLRTDVVDISFRREIYSFHRTEEGSTSNTPDNRLTDLRSIAKFSQEDDLVGIESKKDELIKWLVEGESRLTAIAVTGMGGLGKTTLAGKVYYSERAKQHFMYRAWVTVSQSFKLEDIFRSMVKEFCGSSIRGADNMAMGMLIETLMEFLQQKRYIVVFDDIWKTDDWECIKVGLPSGEMGSRIVVTTREMDVATCCAETSRIYDLQPLSFEDSRALFCKKVFQSECGGQCPLDLKELSDKIVKKCRGLPLAIVAIGSLLSIKRKTPIEWQSVYDSLGYQIKNSPSLKVMKKILSLSINDLPYNLKCCFFYLGIFPEDYLIQPMRIVRLWIAERFVGEKEGGTLEDVAHDYLEELINRSLIQVTKRTPYGKVLAFRVHDIVHEMILSKSKKWNFHTPFEEESKEPCYAIRRLSLNHSRKNYSKNEDLFGLLTLHLRTLFFFRFDYIISLPHLKLELPFHKFRLLKVLDLERASIMTFPEEIEKLLLLRYLNFRETPVYKLPPSIRKLRNLETLDLRKTNVWKLPANIQELKNLRHLLVYCRNFYDHEVMENYYKCGVEVRGSVGSLRSLQTLVYVDAMKSRGVVAEVGMLTQLRKLGILNLPAEDCMDLCVSLGKMTCLYKLHVSSSENGLLDLESASALPSLQHLHLEGRLKEWLPCWIPSLSNLIRLELRNSKLKEDPFEALQRLPNLMVLHLRGAYEGRELSCRIGGFQKLNELCLVMLEELKMATITGGMPQLQKLLIQDCLELHRLPLGIEQLSHLKELAIKNGSSELLKSITGEGAEDYWKISHIPNKEISGPPK